MTEGVTIGAAGAGVFAGPAGAAAGFLARAGRRAAGFRTGFRAEAFFAGFLAAAFRALDFLPDALRAAFLRLVALRFALFLATVVPP